MPELEVTRPGVFEGSGPDLRNGGLQHYVYFDKECMPIAPAKITTTIENKNTTVDLAAGGSYKVLNLPGLTSYEFELIIPHDADSLPFAIYMNGFQTPQHYFDLFERLKGDPDIDKRIFSFVVADNSDSPTLISSLCTLEDYEISQDADEDILDYRVNIRLEKYNRHKTQSFTLKQNADGSWTAVDDGLGDSLQSAADAFNAAMNAVNMSQAMSSMMTGAKKMSQAAADLMIRLKKEGKITEAGAELGGLGTTVAQNKTLAQKNGLNPCETIPAGTAVKV